MIRKITNRLYRVKTQDGYMVFEIDDAYDEDVQNIKKKLTLDSYGHKLNLLVKLAELALMGYYISSVTEFNLDGSRPKVAYVNDKDFVKILKYLQYIMP